MALKNTWGAILVGAIGLAGCTTQQLDQLTNNLTALNSAMDVVGDTNGVNLALPPVKPGKPTELIEPTDKQVKAAMEEALPNIKKVLSITKCVKTHMDLRALNHYAVPGTDMSNRAWVPLEITQYHDKNRCVSVSQIDQWSKPALNTLKFHVAFISDDSGEVSNYLFQFRRVDSGQWLIESLSSM